MSIIPTSVVEDTGRASVITYGPSLGIKKSPYNDSPAIAVVYQDRTIPLLGAVGSYDEDGVPEVSAASKMVVVDAEIDGDYIILLRRSTDGSNYYRVERYDIKTGRQVSTWDSKTFDWINKDQNSNLENTAYVTPYTENWTGYEGFKQEFIRFRKKFSFLSIPSHNTGEIQIRSSKNYTLEPSENNLILTGSKAIYGIGNSLNNKITGNNAKNIINGKGGGDEMIGKKGNDVYYVDNKSDKVIELANQGTDTVRSSITETLSNNVEGLILTGSKAINGNGNSLNNKITGNNNKNNLKGQNGKDKIYGRGGKDVLTGGAKADQFIYKSINDSGTTGATKDVITDFSGVDKINLAKVDADQGTSGNQELVFIGERQFSEAGEVRFKNGLLSVNTDDDLKADMQINLLGVTTFDESSLIL